MPSVINPNITDALATMQISIHLSLCPLSSQSSITLLEDKHEQSFSFIRSQHFQPVQTLKEHLSTLASSARTLPQCHAIHQRLTNRGSSQALSISFSHPHTHTHTHDQLCVRCASESACYIILGVTFAAKQVRVNRVIHTFGPALRASFMIIRTGKDLLRLDYCFTYINTLSVKAFY